MPSNAAIRARPKEATEIQAVFYPSSHSGQIQSLKPREFRGGFEA